jgi:hypothetical protein
MPPLLMKASGLVQWCILQHPVEKNQHQPLQHSPMTAQLLRRSKAGPPAGLVAIYCSYHSWRLLLLLLQQRRQQLQP